MCLRMPRYNLRTLLILLAIGPPALAGGYAKWQRHVEHRRIIKELVDAIARSEQRRQAFQAAAFTPQRTLSASLDATDP